METHGFKSHTPDMKIGGDEWKHSHLDKNIPGRRTTNNNKRLRREERAIQRKKEASKPQRKGTK